MPASYLRSSAGPDQPINSWLSWSSKEYGKIKNDNTFIMALLGINRSGDVQTIYKPVPVVDGEGNITAIIGNNRQWKSSPGFSCVDASSLGSIILNKKLENIPLKICPSEPLPKTHVASTTWAKTNNVGLCLVPILAPIFFGQKSIEGSVFDDNFVDKISSITKKHGKWADLMVEFYNQRKESVSDVDNIVDHLKIPSVLILTLRLSPPQVSKLKRPLSIPTPASISSQTLKNGNRTKKN
jgi:hypothetical protein